MKAQDRSVAQLREVSHTRICRVCGESLSVVFADLGMIPLCQTYIRREDVNKGEPFYPLRALACMSCHYVGLPEYVLASEIFTEYAYFSSTSSSWLDYIRDSAAELIETFHLNAASQVVEMGSNDGYLLRHLVACGIPAVGVDPAANVAKVANEAGVPTLAAFFNSRTAATLLAEGKSADLLLSYNCLDHVSDINDVVAGFKLLLNRDGVVQVELPYLGAMVEHGEFDTIYHDRFSYFSLLSLDFVFRQHGLRIYDVRRLATHGGSLRVRACHDNNPSRPTQKSITDLLAMERAAGMSTPDYYRAFSSKAQTAKFNLLESLIPLRRQGRSIVGYGVPAKGNVLLNYCGIRNDLVDYLVDKSPYKAGKFAPGTRLDIRDVEQVRITRPDYLLILPWNIKEEIIQQMSYIREWGGRFIVPIPQVEVL